MEWIARTVHALRRALRMSQEDFAEYLGASVRTVQNWERAKHGPTPRHQGALDTALARLTSVQRQNFDEYVVANDATEREPAATNQSQRRKAPEPASTGASVEPSEGVATGEPDSDSILPVHRRLFISGLTGIALFADLSAGTRVGAKEVKEYRRVQRSLEQQDHASGGERLYASAVIQLHRLSHLINTCRFSESTGREFRSVAGELAVVTGWFAFDASKHAEAWYYYNEGLTSARLAGDLQVEVRALEKMSRLATEARRPRDAIELAQQAQRVPSASMTARCLSFLHLREALGWAALGERSACNQAIARTKQLFDRGPSDDDPLWLGFYDEAELAGVSALCQAYLRRFAESKALNEESLRHLKPEYVRNQALIAVGLAEACTQTGKPDEAASAGMRALDLLGGVASARASDRLSRLQRGLARHYGGVSSVKDFSQRFQATA